MPAARHPAALRPLAATLLALGCAAIPAHAQTMPSPTGRTAALSAAAPVGAAPSAWSNTNSAWSGASAWPTAPLALGTTSGGQTAGVPGLAPTMPGSAPSAAQLEAARQAAQAAGSHGPAAPAVAASGVAPAPTGSALPAPGTVLRGKAAVVDGATLAVNGTTVRLAGVVAPDASRVCYVGPTSWRCGEAAKRQLETMTAIHPVKCTVNGAAGPTATATCQVGRDDLAGALVRAGLATTSNSAYTLSRAEARADHRGLWLGER